MTINPLIPEERRELAELDEALSTPATQERSADLLLHIHRRAEQIIEALTPKERSILEKRLKRSP